MGITKSEALKAVDRERGPVCEASDKIWDQPETAFQEFHSTDVLCELLEKEGFKVERNLAGIATAFSGTYGFGKPVVGILGEFDALSGLSQESQSLKKSQWKMVHRDMAVDTTFSEQVPLLLQLR